MTSRRNFMRIAGTSAVILAAGAAGLTQCYSMPMRLWRRGRGRCPASAILVFVRFPLRCWRPIPTIANPGSLTCANRVSSLSSATGHGSCQRRIRTHARSQSDAVPFLKFFAWLLQSKAIGLMSPPFPQVTGRSIRLATRPFAASHSFRTLRRCAIRSLPRCSSVIRSVAPMKWSRRRRQSSLRCNPAWRSFR